MQILMILKKKKQNNFWHNFKGNLEQMSLNLKNELQRYVNRFLIFFNTTLVYSTTAKEKLLVENHKKVDQQSFLTQVLFSLI